MHRSDGPAPGAPGIPARWTSSAKSAVGTSVGAASRVWFTASHGIVDEIYYPRIDTACTRDFGLLVSPASGGFLEEKRDARTAVEWLEPGVPAFRLINDLPGCRVTKQILTDPLREVFLQHVVVESDDPVGVTRDVSERLVWRPDREPTDLLETPLVLLVRRQDFDPRGRATACATRLVRHVALA